MLKRTELFFLVFVLFTYLLIGSLYCQEVDTVIAKFGDNQITLSEFRIAYLHLIKQPKVFDSKKLRESFLDELIHGRLLSQEAKRLNIDKNELIEYKINAYRNKCLREEHFQVVIKPLINIKEKDIEDAYLYTQEERRISHLFFISKSTADSVYQMLDKGASFDSLAKIVFKDTALANHGGDLGWVSWDQLEYDLAVAAFRMSFNKYSAPIKSIYGYHIIRVTDFKKKPMISRYEYEIHRRKAKYLLEYKFGDKLAFDFIDKLIKNARISIYPDKLKIVEKKLLDKFKRKPTQLDQMYEVQLNEEEIKTVETNLWDERNQIIAIVNEKNLTIGDFIGYLSFVPYQVIYSGIKNTLNFVFRDYLITEEANQIGLMKARDVLLKTKVYSENLLQLELRKVLVKDVTVNDDEVKKYFNKNKQKYNETSFEQMHDYLKKFLERRKEKRNNSPIRKKFE